MKPLETARILPTGDAPSPYGLHLVLGSVPGSDELGPVPLPLSTEDGATRVYLAALRGAPDSVLELAAVKLLANAFPEGLAESAGRPTNETLAKRFEKERDRLRTLRETSRLFPRLIQPGGKDGPLAELPALLYCRADRTFVEPVCPTCRGGLSTCADEEFLAARKLPSHRDSLERILWCPECARSDANLALWSFAPVEGGGVPVGSPDELLKALSRGMVRDWEEDGVASFGCSGCREEALRMRRERGASVSEFTDRLVPFSFTPSPVVVTGLSPVRIDEWADFVGGRDEASLVPPGAPETLETLSARLRLAWLEETLPANGRLFFGHDGTGLDAVEALALKVTAFRQAVSAVLQFYRVAAQPHLDVKPAHLLVDTYGTGDALPALWTFQVRLHGVAASSRTSAFGVDVVLPPYEPLFPYAAPEMLEFRLAGRRPGDVYVTDVVPEEGDPERRVRLEGRLSDPNGLFPKPEDPDWIHVTFPDEALGIGLASVTLRKQPDKPATYEELAFLSEPLSLDDAAVKKLRRTFGVRIPGARYKVFPRFGAPSDVYALGVVLLRTLAVGEGTELVPMLQGLARVTSAAQRSSEGDPLDRVKRAVAEEPALAGIFDRSSVFWKQIDRTPGRPNAIPPALWERAVVLALRLVLRIPGFSLCTAPGDFSPEDPTARIDETLREVERIEAELRTILFHRQGLHAEMQGILLEVLEEESLSPGSR